MYPMQKMTILSLIEETVRNRRCLKRRLATIPKTIPTANDVMDRSTNSPSILRIIKYSDVPSFADYDISDTAWKRIMEMASLTMASPKMIENSLGCSSYLTMETAAIASEEHSNAPSTRHSSMERLRGTHVYVDAWYISRNSSFMAPYVRPANAKNTTIVPRTPKNRM